MKIVVLLSAGSHPANGRPCRADQDARALQLAFGIENAVVSGVHAGQPDQVALTDYLGQGCADLSVIPVAEGQDVIAPLAACLQKLKPDLILTGMAAEQGEGSGMLPYLLAEQLGAATLPGIAEIMATDHGRLIARQALPGGQRREIGAPLPAVLTIASNAADPGPVVHRTLQQGHIKVLAEPDDAPPAPDASWTYSPAAKRPRRLAQGGKSAGGGLGAIMSGGSGGGGTILDQHNADDIATILLDRLKNLNVVTSKTAKK